jgi:FkbM family methyltransferase
MPQIKLKNGVYFDIVIKAGDYVIDCGANVGDITDFFQSNGANVIAFEPNTHAYTVLKKRFEDNSRVKCVQKGVCGIEKSGTRKLFLHNKANEDQTLYSSGSSMVKDKNNVNKENYINIEVVNLCDFIKMFKKDIKVLKIDIEGAEVELLNDLMDQGLAEKIPYIFVETHEAKIPSIRESTEKLKQRIKNENYSNINLNWI